MIDPSRQVALRSIPWSTFAASAAIEEIVADAVRHFDAERFWPSHPSEDGRPDHGSRPSMSSNAVQAAG
jgi:hypothetical protein